MERVDTHAAEIKKKKKIVVFDNATAKIEHDKLWHTRTPRCKRVDWRICGQCTHTVVVGGRRRNTTGGRSRSGKVVRGGSAAAKTTARPSAEPGVGGGSTAAHSICWPTIRIVAKSIRQFHIFFLQYNFFFYYYYYSKQQYKRRRVTSGVSKWREGREGDGWNMFEIFALYINVPYADYEVNIKKNTNNTKNM